VLPNNTMEKYNYCEECETDTAQRNIEGYNGYEIVPSVYCEECGSVWEMENPFEEE